jgi:hypothetical protein
MRAVQVLSVRGARALVKNRVIRRMKMPKDRWDTLSPGTLSIQASNP